ncbi:hypothetical protein CTheo_2257 [Ceratobasidium theobromae]|uniref:BTB domain-containing protein n=1 Tax=Ceratobasidium theobromae TaxID=1582974 RepID=A0A5N5QSX6_9AGAM|nr:hypothetical protein CTheo_2257 [Ceratobasidium theobromae]
MIHGSRSMSAINASTPMTPRRPHANTVSERPTTMLVSPPHSPQLIQSHLYQMFLAGHTADVALVVRGSWQAQYNLHRVILIQSDYFRTLFTNGFRESRSGASADMIELHFDDPNITRAAFEICIARLYGGGPDLFVDPALIPSIQHPLTSSFPLASAASPVPPASHPATPRFLLSLLATANYLHIPSVTSQALLLVLSTIGPWTVTRYFGFAIGQGIGQPEGSEPEAAVGLDDIGQPAPAVAPKEQTSQPPKPDDVLPQEDEEDEEDLVKVSSLGSSTSNSRKHRAVSGASQHTFETQSIYTESPDDGEPTFFYGVVGDKIGEACACWLARWGADILALEEAVEARLHPPRASTPPKLASPFPKLAHKRNLSQPVSNPVPQTFSSFFASMSLQSASNSTSSLNFPRRRSPSQSVLISPVVASSAPTTAPRVWSHGGMPARWARAVMCSDNLFVRGEWERFVFMTRVVELRRRQLAREATEATGAAAKKIEQLKRSEELEWDEMFKTGIYYSHIALEDLYRISQEPSSNGKPFVELSTLQSALWRQSILRCQITSHSTVSNSRPNSPAPASSSISSNSTEGELGGLVSTADILLSPPDDTKVYYPIPTDASIRVGHDRTNSVNIIDNDLDLDVLSPRATASAAKIRKPASESDLFGLRPSRRTAREIVQEHERGGVSETAKWSVNEPFRFSVEFWGLDTLKEKNRLHSHTVWYAGSMYNVYVQVIKKKGMQLGVYLHRQSAVDPIPPASAPASFALLNPPTPTEAGTTVVAPRPQSVSSSAPRSSLLTNAGLIGSPPTPTPRAGTAPPERDAPVTSPPSAPVAPWRDPRRVARSYFIMTCPSLVGSSLTRFQSGPDDFKISQSWGWKSSCLWSEAEAEEPAATEDSWISLRATVMIGVV